MPPQYIECKWKSNSYCSERACNNINTLSCLQNQNCKLQTTEADLDSESLTPITPKCVTFNPSKCNTMYSIK